MTNAIISGTTTIDAPVVDLDGATYAIALKRGKLVTKKSASGKTLHLHKYYLQAVEVEKFEDGLHVAASDATDSYKLFRSVKTISSYGSAPWSANGAYTIPNEGVKDALTEAGILAADKRGSLKLTEKLPDIHAIYTAAKPEAEAVEA